MMTQRAIITGASTGIGRELVRLLAKEGYSLGLMSRNTALLEELKAELLRDYPGLRVALRACDVGDLKDARAAIGGLAEELGGLDLMIANAGIGQATPAYKDFSDMTEKILRVNVMGAIATLEAAKKIMVGQKRGHLVGVSSIASVRGLPNSAAYSTSKAALSTYLESTRIDLRRTGIAVTAVHPGYVATPMTAKNPFMPFLMPADRAAQVIYRGIIRKKARVFFPWQMGFIYDFLRYLPHWMYDALMRFAK